MSSLNKQISYKIATETQYGSMDFMDGNPKMIILHDYVKLVVDWLFRDGMLLNGNSWSKL